jgi:hypothetical protein
VLSQPSHFLFTSCYYLCQSRSEQGFWSQIAFGNSVTSGKFPNLSGSCFPRQIHDNKTFTL